MLLRKSENYVENLQTRKIFLHAQFNLRILLYKKFIE